ncbi:MAG: hypothetical protein WC074_02090, partial [bacterium]
WALVSLSGWTYAQNVSDRVEKLCLQVVFPPPREVRCSHCPDFRSFLCDMPPVRFLLSIPLGLAYILD